MEDNLEKKLGDNGEYLIRSYLEPSERIKYKYNYKRVVVLDRHDGIFLIGELSLYIIENFYIDDSSAHEILKRDYQLRAVAIEMFSMDGCNDLLVFHKKEKEEVFKNLVPLNIPRNTMLDTTVSGSVKPDSNEGSSLFKVMANSFFKRW
ncbi:hypothetical protein BC332_07182 [Capsicum chinense]|nr:hypothetical protein BC332_07182 [Capsicum chinense]